MLVASCAGVFATDDNAVDANLTSKDTDNVLEADNTDSEILSDPAGTFTDLNNDISNAGSVLELTRNYTFNSASDSGLKDGVTINKKLTINGNGYTIDASNSARVFNILADGVILNNITIKNAYLGSNLLYADTSINNVNISEVNGAGILWSGANGVLNNSIIMANNINVNITIYNTNDINAGYYIGNGAGIYWTGDGAKIENTFFYNNTITINCYTLNTFIFTIKYCLSNIFICNIYMPSHTFKFIKNIYW